MCQIDSDDNRETRVCHFISFDSISSLRLKTECLRLLFGCDNCFQTKWLLRRAFHMEGYIVNVENHDDSRLSPLAQQKRITDLQIPAQETEENMWKSTRTVKSKVQVHWFLWGLEDCVGCSRSSRAFLGLPQGFWTEMYINQEYSTNLSGRRRGISTGMALVVRNSWKGNHPNGSLPHHSPEGAPWTKRANSAWSSMRAAAWC